MTRIEVLHLDNMQHEATDGEHSLVMDEPNEVGGDNVGMTPYETLLSALGGCIAMTLRLYARRKEWPLEDVRVILTHDKLHAKDCQECEHEEGMLDVIRRKVEIKGDLTPEQHARLQEIATRCPVHRTLTGTIEVLHDDSLA
ncbi:MAG: OsmC family protein [Candidatus Latescibacterota bacterium]|nr:MAG: OsmC family protein [Candidatus Latescibacterota bacterium]